MDDNSSRFRSGDPYGRGANAPANDPLAELARLIGQSDPFSEARRDPPRAPEPPAASSYGTPPDHSAPYYGDAPAQQYAPEQGRAYQPEPPSYEPPQPAPYYPPEPAPYQPEPAPRYSAEPAPRFVAAHPSPRFDSAPQHQEWAPPPQPYPQHDPLSMRSQPAPGFQPPPVNNHYAGPQADSFEPHVPGFDYDYRQAPPRPNFPPPIYPHEPEAGSMPPPHDDEFYEDTPRRGRRRGFMTVVAVFGLAVVGTAGAFGYRNLFSGHAMSGPPPVIRASGEPSRVAPPPQSTDQSASKFSYDRFSDAGKDEKVVRREETPVDLRAAAPPPRTVLPGAPVPTANGKPASAMASANPPSALGDPRKVRTVPIRPDQGDIAANSPMASDPVSVAPPRQASPPAQMGETEAATPPAPAPRAAAPRAPARAARTSPPPAPVPAAPAANAPLSLSPDASNDFPPLPSAQQRSPARAAAAPMRVASAPASGAGSYLVQVTSQRSEADAQSSYRSIQSKYSTVLGSQPHVIRKADLGSKGVYYRAMVGPFGSREQALQLCTSLKQAGGDCVVQH